VIDSVSMRSLLGPHIPALRRHARALYGSQRSGDGCVRSVLEALLEAPDRLPEASTPKIALFRLLHALPRVNDGWLPGREGLLLTAIEEFSIEEAAEILGRDLEAVAAQIAAAKADISDQIRSRILIIEDEPVISMHLEQIVEDIGHSVAGVAMTRAEAVEIAKVEMPDMVLADVQLADGSSGVDAVNDILAQFDVPVIFITAYPERLLTGERPEPTFLMTKPFEAAAVVATIGQALLARKADLAPIG